MNTTETPNYSSAVDIVYSGDGKHCEARIARGFTLVADLWLDKDTHYHGARCAYDPIMRMYPLEVVFGPAAFDATLAKYPDAHVVELTDGSKYALLKN